MHLGLQIGQQLANGLALGSIYALLALGYTMVYGIIKLINFAHGDLLMLGAFGGYFVLCRWGVSLQRWFWPYNLHELLRGVRCGAGTPLLPAVTAGAPD
jgi:branched-subunit amino acid ABC-type transport system permease component